MSMRYMMHELNIEILLLAVICLLLMAGPVYAQNATGTILGNVIDSNGAVVPGAAAPLRTSLSRTANTSSEGSYRFALKLIF